MSTIPNTPCHPLACGGAMHKLSFSGSSENSELQVNYQPQHFQPDNEDESQCSDIEENGSGFDNQKLRSNQTISAQSLDISHTLEQI